MDIGIIQINIKQKGLIISCNAIQKMEKNNVIGDKERTEKMESDRRKVIIAKADFYYSLNLKCHIKIKPIGFRNGKIMSEFIEQGSYFNFMDLRHPEKPQRLFIDEIHDIKDYEEPIEEGVVKK